ncbi:hypothetical protein L5515_004952 [Caenorhabditis briggsae]|uniref:C2H2-type domain-containing protein n=1 Tax=Caenorhabditis briggsae TaxID=6238 RepID=A0AAE9JBS1_CAEBR|nr:hypothetical protein L5515_004952 [Caenorhabditis briggsae]
MSNLDPTIPLHLDIPVLKPLPKNTSSSDLLMPVLSPEYPIALSVKPNNQTIAKSCGKSSKSKAAPYFYACHICAETFKTPTLLHRHQCKAYNTKNICIICDTYLPPNQPPKHHLHFAHSIVKPVECGCCSWTFRNIHEKNNHRRWLISGVVGGNGFTIPVILNGSKPGTFMKFSDRFDKRVRGQLEVWQTVNHRKLSASMRSPSTIGNSNWHGMNAFKNLPTLTVLGTINQNLLNSGSIASSPPSSSSTDSSADSSPMTQNRKLDSFMMDDILN